MARRPLEQCSPHHQRPKLFDGPSGVATDDAAPATWLTLGEVARHLRVSARTVQRWRERGLPGVAVGGVVRFDVAAVDRWMRAQAAPPPHRGGRR